MKFNSLHFPVLSQVIFRDFKTVNPAVLHSCHSKDKGKTQGVQLPGPSGPKAPRTSLNFFRLRMSLTSQLQARKNSINL